MNNVFVYTLSEPIGNIVKYVGVTRYPKLREKQHLTKIKDNTYKTKWVKSLLEKGEIPVFEIIETCSENDWEEVEQYWIQFFLGWGFKLTNGDRGGLSRVRHSPELRRKISETLKGRPNLALSKRVVALDKDTLVPIFCSRSLADAAKVVDGSHCNIVRVLKSGRVAYGHRWTYSLD